MDAWLGGGIFLPHFRIAVPFFFVTSGYLYFSRDASLKKYVKRLLTLDIAWTILEFPFILYKCFIINYSDTNPIFSVFDFFKALLWGESYMGSWFIHASWMGMIALNWILQYCSKFTVHILCVLCFILALVDTSYQSLILGTGLGTAWHFMNKIIYPSESFILAIPYLYAGKVIAERKGKASICYVLFFSFILFFEAIFSRRFSNIGMMFNPRFEQFLSLLPFTVSFVWWLKEVSWQVPKWISILMRQQSILIFLLHQPLIMLTYKCTGLSMGGILYALVVIESIILATLIIHASPKYKIIKYLY